MSIFNEPVLNQKIIDYLNDDIKNPILRKVIEEEFIYSTNLVNILQNYLSELTTNENYENKLNSLNMLIKNISIDNNNHLRNELSMSFINLNKDQHLFFIININDNIKNIFQNLNNNNKSSNILKNILSGLSIGINNEYIMKCIDSCKIINKNISDSIVEEYIKNNNIDIVMNDTLLSYFLKYLSMNINNKHLYAILNPIINVKLTSIMSNLNTIKLDNMNFAYEIYKLGKIVLNGNLTYTYPSIFPSNTFIFSNEQLEYIAKSVHTCIINKNISQAQGIHSIIYYMDSLTYKYMKYYNKFLVLRMKNTSNDDLLSNEYELWNINKDYQNIMSYSFFSEYKQYINNIKYSILINNDIKKIKIKNSNILMNKINVSLKNDINFDQEIKHHPTINDYIDNLNKYINIRAPLQKIQHSMSESNIIFKTKMGSIKCSLIIGSILLYLQDSPLNITDLIEKTNISEKEILNKLDILYLNNIIVKNEDNSIYKYIEPFGDVDCTITMIKTKEDINTNVSLNKFTDIVITIESRIIKEVKPNKMNIMELERRIQEFMGESYVRSIFYQRIDSLKNKFYIKEVDSIIEYIP
jgi:DNA-binding transcriptional regulator GbsR (MarR family)